MKNLVSILLVFACGFECFSSERGDPFAPYKEQGYSIKEAVDIISIDSILVLEYRNLFQQIAEKDGWIKSIKGRVLSLENTVYLIQNLNIQNKSWDLGEIIIRSRKGNKFYNLDRPSWSDRKNKVPGEEPVGILDVTKILGLWNGENSYPLRIVMIMRCLNSAYDTRYQILPVAPLIEVISDGGERTAFYAAHDTVWVQRNSDNYITNNYYNNENNCNNCESYYTSPVYEPSCSGFGISFGFGYSSFPSYPSYVYQGGDSYNYYSYDYDYNYYEYQEQGQDPPPYEWDGNGQGQDPPPNPEWDGGGTGQDPQNPARGSYNAIGGKGEGNNNIQKNVNRSSLQNEMKVSKERVEIADANKKVISKSNDFTPQSKRYSQPSRSSSSGSYSQPNKSSSKSYSFTPQSKRYSQPSRSSSNGSYSQPSRSSSNSYSQPSRPSSGGSYSSPSRSSSMSHSGGYSGGGGYHGSSGGGRGSSMGGRR
jgi:hypothetical protein